MNQQQRIYRKKEANAHPSGPASISKPDTTKTISEAPKSKEELKNAMRAQMEREMEEEYENRERMRALMIAQSNEDEIVSSTTANNQKDIQISKEKRGPSPAKMSKGSGSQNHSDEGAYISRVDFSFAEQIANQMGNFCFGEQQAENRIDGKQEDNKVVDEEMPNMAQDPTNQQMVEESTFETSQHKTQIQDNEGTFEQISGMQSPKPQDSNETNNINQQEPTNESVIPLNQAQESQETQPNQSQPPKKKAKKKSKAAVVKPDGPKPNLRSRMAALRKQQENEMKEQKVGVVYDEEMLLHRNHRDSHPERPERVMAIYLNLIKKKIWDDLVRIDACPATDDVLALAHSQSHIQKVKDTIYNNKTVRGKQVELQKNQNTFRFKHDTYENKYTAQAAYLSAGGTVEAIRALCNPNAMQPIDSVFAIVRPPGHHAHCSDIGGFCFFNNVAVAARVAQKEFNKRKVCIFDWDVHVGDGTSNVFYNDDSVLYISIHRFDMGKFFPGPKGKHEMIGECKGKGYNIHFPFNMPKQTGNQEDFDQQNIGDKDYIYVCETLFFPIIREFNPDLIIISAGFDSAKGDPLGEIAVSPIGYAWMTQGLRNIQKCIGVVLEGGYSLEALEVSSESVFKVLKTHPNDTAGFNEILEYYGATEENNSYGKLIEQALLYPRYSFKVTASNIAKLIKKYWGNAVEDLIFEKPRRKSSNQSKKSSNDSPNSESIREAQNGRPSGLRLTRRLNSMDDSNEKIQPKQLSKGTEQNDGACPSPEDATGKTKHSSQVIQRPGMPGAPARLEMRDHRKLSAIIQVDDPIDERAEIERELQKQQEVQNRR